MEILTILLSVLLAIPAPVGVVVDRVANNIIRSRLDRVEQLSVRVDNTPNYQIAKGKVDRVRVAGRGLWLTPDIRVDTLELETDPIAVDIQALRGLGQQAPTGANLQSLREIVSRVSDKPLQTAVRLVLTEKDLNQALQSPAATAQLQQIGKQVLGALGESGDRFQVTNPKIDILDNQRVQFQVTFRDPNTAEQLGIKVETGLGTTAGRLQLVNPTVALNDRELPSLLVGGFIRSFNDRLNLRDLEAAGVTTRFLKSEVSSDRLELATFIRIAPTP